MNKDRRVARLTWAQVAERLASGAPAILPIGAGAKEHGLHMPMGTDAVQARFLALKIAEAIDGLIWPVLTYGYYPAFVHYAGSISLSRSTFEHLVRELVTGIAGFGARVILVLDTGLSTNAPVAAALDASGLGVRVRHLKAYAGPKFLAAVARISEQTMPGSHADEVETSLMLAIAPQCVDRDAAGALVMTHVDARAPTLSPNDASSPGFSPSGATGEPALATAEKGRLLLAAMLDDLVTAAADEGNIPNFT